MEDESRNTSGEKPGMPDAPTDASAPSRTADEVPAEPQDTRAAKPKLLARFAAWYGTHKKLSIPLTVLLVLGILLAVPATRYPLLGTVVKRTLTVTVIDSQTNKPVTSANVTVAGISVQTNNKGQASLRLAVGPKAVAISKKYYASSKADTLVPVFKNASLAMSVKATGRQVPITVSNKITGQPIANASLKAAGTQVKTDKDGKASIVLPADQKTVKAILAAASYNTKDVTIEVAVSETVANGFTLTPSGKVYFLSNASGKIDVVKTNLDGSSRQVVLAGTGKEESANTTLLASRDWKYLALLSKRDGGENAKLFLIETATDTLSTVDEGATSFTLSGWNGSHFVYTVNRTNYKDSQPKKNVIKSFDASTRKMAVLAESEAEGSENGHAYQTLVNPFLVDEGKKVVYHTQWYNGGSDYTAASNIAKSKNIEITSVHVDGSNRKVLKSLPTLSAQGYYTQVTSVVYAPDEIYYRADAGAFYEYEDGQLKDVSDVNSEKFFEGYPTYLQSPSGDKMFWGEARDGKNTLFVGNKSGDEGKLIASLSEYQTYGWYTEDYLLVSKGGSELSIMSAKPSGTIKPFKISDYYKPAFTYRGYGGGYGGL